ncbi:MAG: hypothetical protein K1X47_00815 [Cyclobacteriaceae bacterium]|nr:hypothetical protein [Cyclobacteriaceae bacterium]
MKKSIIAVLVLLTPLSILAHPGHGHDNPLGPGHYVGNPEHALPLALTIAVAMFVVGYAVRTLSAKAQKKD